MSHSDHYSLEGSTSQWYLHSPPSHNAHLHGTDTLSQPPGPLGLIHLPTPGGGVWTAFALPLHFCAQAGRANPLLYMLLLLICILDCYLCLLSPSQRKY